MNVWIPTPAIPPTRIVPRLECGEVLDQPAFHARYQAMPESLRAELLEGVVYVNSPASDEHGHHAMRAVTWIGVYAAQTTGLLGSDAGTVILNAQNEVQPDAFLLLPPQAGGACRLTEEGFRRGPPELVVEVAVTSAAKDLHAKRRVYQQAGVREYVVVVAHDAAVRWFRLVNGAYVEIAPDANGFFKSEVFPGLWLDAPALLRGDGKQLLTTLQQGLSTPEHAAFVSRLQAAIAGPGGG